MINIIKKEKINKIFNNIIFMIIFILPFIKPAPEITGNFDNVIDIFKAILCILVFAVYISYKKPSKLLCIISIIQTIFLISTLINPYGKIKWQIVQFVSIIGIIMFTELSIEINYKKAIKAFAISCGIMLILTIISMFITYPNGLYQVIYDGYTENNNFLWGFDNSSIFKILPTLMFLMLFSINNKKNIVAVLATIFITLIAFIYVKSITAILILGILLIYYITINYIKTDIINKIFNFRNLFIFVIAIFLILLIFNMNNVVLNKLASITEKGGSLQYRFNVWKDTLNVIKDKPLLGYGYSEAEVEIQRLNIDHPHNIFLDIAYRGGIISLTLYLYMIIFMFKDKLMENKDNKIGQILNITLFLILLSSQMDYYNDQYLIFVVYVFINEIKKVKISLIKNIQGVNERDVSNMNSKILTISVAAYNLENMIEQNIKSFINSKVRDDIEVIITDDGSKDRTVEIVEKYEKEYPNTIKLIKQKNAGPGSTVNSGILHATGKYFKMVDGDDWVETENLEQFINYLKNTDADMVLTNYEVYDNQKNEITETIKINLPSNEVLNFNDVCSELDLQMHSVAFKTKILQDNKIKLDNGFYTDVEYLLFPVPHLNTVSYLDVNIYVYRVAQATQSVSIPSMQKNIKMHDQVLNTLIQFYEKNKHNIQLNKKNYIANRLAVMANTQLGTLLTFDQNEETKNKIKEFNKNLKANSKDIYNKYKKSKRAKIILYSNYYLCNFASKKFIQILNNN